ncbi:MAG: toll/interleukin-1 receptor domain-containing protein [bacterium]
MIIDEARRAIVESIELIRWIGESVLPVTPEAAVREKIQLPDQRGDRDLGIFISYSSTDKNVAEQIASVLKGFKYNVFYAEWSISAGESIVNKINEGLAKNDILVILLSPESVNSRWVKKELDTALMRQLAGHQVQVVPVLITSCEIPTELLSIKYVDLTEDFQGNLMKLIQSLQDLTQRGETGP